MEAINIDLILYPNTVKFNNAEDENKVRDVLSEGYKRNNIARTEEGIKKDIIWMLNFAAKQLKTGSKSLTIEDDREIAIFIFHSAARKITFKPTK